MALRPARVGLNSRKKHHYQPADVPNTVSREEKAEEEVVRAVQCWPEDQWSIGWKSRITWSFSDARGDFEGRSIFQKQFEILRSKQKCRVNKIDYCVERRPCPIRFRYGWLDPGEQSVQVRPDRYSSRPNHNNNDSAKKAVNFAAAISPWELVLFPSEHSIHQLSLPFFLTLENPFLLVFFLSSFFSPSHST